MCGVNNVCINRRQDPFMTVMKILEDIPFGNQNEKVLQGHVQEDSGKLTMASSNASNVV